MNKLTQRKESNGVLRRRRAARDADRRVRQRFGVLRDNSLAPRLRTNQRADDGHDHQSKPDRQDEYGHQISKKRLEDIGHAEARQADAQDRGRTT